MQYSLYNMLTECVLCPVVPRVPFCYCYYSPLFALRLPSLVSYSVAKQQDRRLLRRLCWHRPRPRPHPRSHPRPRPRLHPRLRLRRSVLNVVVPRLYSYI